MKAVHQTRGYIHYERDNSFYCLTVPALYLLTSYDIIRICCQNNIICSFIFSVNPVLERHETALLMLLGFGGFSIILAFLHNAVRKHVFHDEHNLDTTFDAGGNVSLSLTAVTVASQLFWPGDILHSATLSTKVILNSLILSII